MSKLPKTIKLKGYGETIEFSLTDKREIRYYGKTKTSNESLWRTDKLKDNEVFYQTVWGGVFLLILIKWKQFLMMAVNGEGKQ